MSVLNCLTVSSVKTKDVVLKNVCAAHFHTIKVNGDPSSQEQKSLEKYHKTNPFDSCTIFQVFWSFLSEKLKKLKILSSGNFAS